MIVFRLEHTLYIQYDQVMRQFLDEWMLDETFGIEGDDFIFPLENGEYFGYNLTKNAFTKLQFSAEQRKILHNEDADEWKEERLEAEVCRFLLMLIRRNNQVAPFADDYMISVLQGKMDQKLESVGLAVDVEHVSPEDAGEASEPQRLLAPVLKLHGEEIYMEQFFMHIAMTSEKVTQPIIQYVAAPVEGTAAMSVAEPEAVPEPVFEEAPAEPAVIEPEPEIPAVEETALPAVEDASVVETEEIPEEEETPEAEGISETEETPETEEAPEPEEISETIEEPEEKAPVAEAEPEIPAEIAAAEYEHFKKAIMLFNNILGDAQPGSEKYNSVCFNLGELMYCRDDMSCAAYFYKKCDIEMLEDKDDFYERLGHCYLDNKMNAFSGPLKLYFKAEQNEAFRKSHAKQIESMKPIAPEEIAKYRKLCIKFGKEKY